jgi:NADH dehydrogenase/NADH:ubiquinone oxidoreductase subunit G
MPDVQLTLNGVQVTGRSDQSILELARDNGIEIPTLCYIEGLPPTGACRVCVVEVDGSRTLVASCHTPIAKGMVIQTHSPRVLETRRLIVELLLADHCGNCFQCDKANMCELRKVAADLGVALPRFQLPKRWYQVEDVSPYIERDLSKCILCRRCVKACSEIAKKGVLSVAYRGSDSKIVYDADQPLDTEACRDCDVCISRCPTGALAKPRKVGREKKAKPLLIKG